jgi:hypothetical protein
MILNFFLNLLKSQDGDWGRKEKNGGDEPIQVIMHMYMEMSQWDSLCSYLKQTEMSILNERQEGKQV